MLVRTKRPLPGGRGEQWLLIKHRDRWSGEVDVTELADSVKSFGGLASILKTHDTPAEWKAQPPAKGGDAGRMFRQILAIWTDEIRAPELSATKSRPTRGRIRHSGSAPPAGRKLASTNRQKVLFPKTGFTKGDLIDYYTHVAPLLLPHLAGRAVTFKRFPDGVDSKSFFQKRCPGHHPAWVNTVHVPGKTAGDKSIDYCTIDSEAALQWAANLAAIELHVPLAKADAPDTPTAVTFDLDPGEPADMTDCASVALRLKSLLDEMKLVSMPKLSGSKGIHVLVSLTDPSVTFSDTKAFAKAVAHTLERDDPGHVTTSMSKSRRSGRVFIDWGQNDRDKTNAAMFSIRARAEPTVSWPLTWEQVAGTFDVVLASDAKPDLKTAKAALRSLTRKQRLPKLT